MNCISCDIVSCPRLWATVIPHILGANKVDEFSPNNPSNIKVNGLEWALFALYPLIKLGGYKTHTINAT
jgi:hypothetical protein